MIFVHQINRKTTSALIGQNLSLIGTDNPWKTESYFLKTPTYHAYLFENFVQEKDGVVLLEIERALLVDIIHKHTTKNNKNLFKELESHKEKGGQKGKEKGRNRGKRFS